MSAPRIAPPGGSAFNAGYDVGRRTGYAAGLRAGRQQRQQEIDDLHDEIGRLALALAEQTGLDRAHDLDGWLATHREEGVEQA